MADAISRISHFIVIVATSSTLGSYAVSLSTPKADLLPLLSFYFSKKKEWIGLYDATLTGSTFTYVTQRLFCRDNLTYYPR